MSRWYRRYTGTVSDPKIAEVALIAECSRSVAIATWDMILESAAETNGGSRFRATSRNVAATICEPLATIERVFLALQTLKMIDGDAIVAWSKRQFQSDSSTERSRKHRAAKAATVMQRCATPPDTETETDTETEKSTVRPEYDAAHATAGGHDEIGGLNGSTGEIVAGVAKFLNQLAPDYVTARRVIASNVGLYGDRAVRDGYAELMADVADNKVRVPSVKALLGYFKTASERPGRRPEKPIPSDFASQRIERARSFTAKLNVGTAA